MKKSMKLTLLIIIPSVLYITSLFYRTDEVGARKTLVLNNYKPIEVGGYNFAASEKQSWYSTNFKAISPNGDTCTGVVLGRLFDGGNVIKIIN